jgi:hypothetical protein
MKYAIAKNPFAPKVRSIKKRTFVSIQKVRFWGWAARILSELRHRGIKFGFALHSIDDWV